jgi:branched-chain amino acid transport system permease protein
MKNFKNILHYKRVTNCIILAALFIAPLITSDPYFMRLAVLTLIYSILSMSLCLLIDFTGIVSLGHAALFGIGAYVTAILGTKTGLPFWFILPISAISSSLIASFFGFITFKSLKGIYFALASWALVEILRAVYMNVDFFGGTNGIRGIPEPTIFGFSITSDVSFYYFALFFSILSLVSIERLLISRIGRAWMAIREDQIVAGVMGVNVFLFQIVSFGVSAFYAGIGGSIYAYYEIYISPNVFSIWESIFLVCMVLVGGKKSLPGAIVGAAIFTILPELLRGVGQFRMIIYGLILFLTIIYRPKGLIPPYWFLYEIKR